uniref:Uncharacterized protein n=1 Tax=Arundo donax TaxID=35708 RepID=A0A0A9AL45_ARUDO
MHAIADCMTRCDYNNLQHTSVRKKR